MNRSNTAVSSNNGSNIRYGGTIPNTQHSRRSFAPQPAGAPPMLPPQHNARSQLQNRAKKRKLVDKLLPVQVRELVPESQAYMDLLAFEQKLDATITRKKLDIQEALKRPIKVKRRLRIYISHTFIPGKEPEREGEEGTVPMWELRVEGRLLDEPSTGTSTVGGGAAQNRSQPLKRKFSSFFKSLVIELDKEIYGPDNHLVEWHRTPQTNETDGFQVKRPGDRDVKCTILLLLDYQPMKFKLHPRLGKVLGMATETRPKIIEALWQYIKTHKLQDQAERDNINCDAYLEQIFGVKRMRFMEIPQRLQSLLHQPDPLILHHTIQYSEGNEKNTACYDIDVEMEDPLKTQMTSFLHSHANMPDISALDQKIFDIVEQINEWKLRRDFYVRFADNPQEFIHKWLISQSNDLKTMTEIFGDSEVERHAEYYYQPQIMEGTFRYIYHKVQQKRAELESTKMNESLASCSNEHRCSFDVMQTDAYSLPRKFSEEQKEIMRKQVPASDFKRIKLQEELRKNWDKFYLRNKSNFFKDRWWIQHELGGLLEQHIDFQDNLNFLEAGCGVGNLVFPLMHLYPHWNFYAFDFSDKAIRLLRGRSEAHNFSINTVVADLTSDRFSLDFPAADIISLIFVLSAIPPCKQQQAVKNLLKLVKVRGMVFVRDYGINDHAMLRFGRHCKLDERFYAKHDGTMTYYFKLEELDDLFIEQGFRKVKSTYLLRKTVNHQKDLSVDRVFVQAVYAKPLW
ncbi:SWI/SNF chromatin-remodeling accessory subunit [Dirofilaria immitis]